MQISSYWSRRSRAIGMEGLGGSENEEGRDGLMELGGCGWPDLENGEEGGGFGWWFGSGGDPKEEETLRWRRRRMGQVPRS